MAINDLRASAGDKSMTVTLRSGRVCGQLENSCPNLPIVVVPPKQNTTAGWIWPKDHQSATVIKPDQRHIAKKKEMMIHIIFFQNYEQQTLQHAFTEATVCNGTPPFYWLEESNGIWAIQLRWGLIPPKTYLGALMTGIKYKSTDWYTSKPTGVLTDTCTHRYKYTRNPGEAYDSSTKASSLRILCV